MDNLKIIIKNYCPDVILLNETWLEKKYNVRCKGYQIIREDRADGYGGFAILVKNNISFQILSINNQFQAKVQMQSVFLPQYNLNILNIYSPSNDILPKQGWINLIQSLNKPLLIMGDMNANHKAWGSSNNSRNGQNIIDTLDQLELVFLNDGSPTRISPQEEVSQ